MNDHMNHKYTFYFLSNVTKGGC